MVASSKMKKKHEQLTGLFAKRATLHIVMILSLFVNVHITCIVHAILHTTIVYNLIAIYANIIMSGSTWKLSSNKRKWHPLCVLWGIIGT